MRAAGGWSGRWVLVLGLLGGCPKPTSGAGAVERLPEAASDPAAPLPVDERVHSGTLSNGLTYFVERNTRPEARVELRLAVRVGSILEDPDQLGLAHFVEHMAFNGSEHFEGSELVRYLESIGTDFGAHLNAYTSFDETVYQLRIPTDDPAIVDKGLLVLRDWAGGLRFDPAECERERGVVLEEWRLGQGLGQRIQDATLHDLYGGSPYAERLPIGTEQSLKSFDCAAAKRFYDDWYRPELMAVMAVGDVDVPAFEAKLRERFGDLRSPEPARERVYYRVPDHDDLRVTIFADAELTGSGWQLVDLVDDVQSDTHAGYRRYLGESVLWTIVNERLAVRGQDEGSPLLGAGAQESSIAWQRAVQMLGVAPKEGRELEALEVALVEVERVRRHGVTSAELQRAVNEVGRGFQAYYDERDKTDSATHVEELIRVFLTDEPMPGIPYEYTLAATYLPELSVAEINALAGELFTGTSRAVQLLAIDKPGVVLPTEEQVRALLADVAARPIAAPEAEVELAPLMARPPKRGKVVAETSDAAMGTLTWRLSNGATVIVRPSAFQQDELVLEAFSPGGSSLVSDEDYIPAITATAIAVGSGLGDNDAIALGKLLAGHSAQVSPYLGERSEGLSGGGSAQDSELLLQLVHLSFTAPRFDAAAFDREIAARTESLRNRSASPDAQFWDEWTRALWPGHERYQPWTLQDLERMDLARSEAIYRERFADASDFTFVFGGSIDPASFKPLVERYLASLPSSVSGKAASGEITHEQAKDLGMRAVEGVHTRTMSSGETPRARVQLRLHGPFESNWSSRNLLSAVEQVLATRLREALREDRGGTYGVSVDAGSTEAPVQTWSVDVGFECDPDRVEELVAAMWATLDEVQAAPPSEELIASIREKRRRERETSVRSNRFWVGGIAGTLQRGEDVAELLTFEQRNEALTPDAALEMLRRVLDRSNQLLMIQRPEP